MSAESTRKWKLKNPEKVKAAKAKYCASPEGKAKNAAWQLARHKRNFSRLLSDLRKAAPCTDCGGRFPSEVMEFDHLDASNKKDDVTVLVRALKTHEVVLAEIDKCELVCANCHRIRTMNRRFDTAASGQ